MAMQQYDMSPLKINLIMNYNGLEDKRRNV